MRKLRIAAMALTIALVAAVGASAAAGQTEHYKLQGATAQAIWLHGNTFTLVDAQSDSVFGTIVFFDRFTPHFDQHGNFIGGTDVSGAAVGRRVSLSLGKLLSSATLTASIPIKRCTVTASGNETGCTREGSIALTLAFTGVGPTAHGGSNDHFHYPGVTITDHLVGTQREATVTGTIAGQHVLAATSRKRSSDTSRAAASTSATAADKPPAGVRLRLTGYICAYAVTARSRARVALASAGRSRSR